MTLLRRHRTWLVVAALGFVACGGGDDGEMTTPAETPGGTSGAAGSAGATAGKGGGSAGGKAGAANGGKAGQSAAGAAGASAGAGGDAGNGGASGAGSGGAGSGGASGAGSGGDGGASGAGMGGASGAGASGGAGGGAAGQAGAGGAVVFKDDPIVLVHGYGVKAAWWDPAVAYFVGKGYPPSHVRAIDFTDVYGSTAVQAKELAAFVTALEQELGVTKVDILSHSMGGLTTRMYLKFEGGHDHVRDYVSFGGAHHGTNTACATLGAGAAEMCPIYSDKDTTVQWKLNGNPDLDDVDETPFGVEDGGSVSYSSFWSDGDLILSPNQTACLNQKMRDDCSDPVNTLYNGILHSQMNSHPQMLADALTRFRAHGP